MELDFTNLGPRDYSIYEKKFVELMEKTFNHLNVTKNYEVSCVIVDNSKILEINKEYRKIDRPTDVISFAFQDNEDNILFSSEMPIALGDIYISFEKAVEQSIEYGHSIEREFSFLFVHGLLHLLGYDHMKKEDEVEMFKLQDEILGERK